MDIRFRSFKTTAQFLLTTSKTNTSKHLQNKQYYHNENYKQTFTKQVIPAPANSTTSIDKKKQTKSIHQ